MDRDLIIIGNWKMHKTSREAIDYIERISPMIQGCQSRVLLAVPYPDISSAVSAAKQTSIIIGAQNVNDSSEGALTGEVSAIMLKEAGARFVIVGHSERRLVFGETDEWVNRKVLRALQDDLQPVVCIGETAKERADGMTEKVIQHQLNKALSGVPDRAVEQLIIAYEPVWAIGSGNASTPKVAEEVHSYCRKCLEHLFGSGKANRIPILYGGSVKANNVKELVLQKDIDGVLVGDASLDPDTFSAIIQNCEGIQ